MKCLFFKKKSDNNNRAESKSAPVQNERRRKNPALDRVCKSTSSIPSPRSLNELYKEKAKDNGFRVFELQELMEATNGFHRMLKIGEGGFGSVFKGTIRPPGGRGDPIVVAIKKLNKHGFQVHVSVS